MFEEEEEEEEPPSPRQDEEMELAGPSNLASVEAGPDLASLASGIRMSEEAGDGDPTSVPNEEEEEGGSDESVGDGLFGDDGADDDDDDDDDMEMVEIQAPSVAPVTNGTPQVGEKRKLSEDDEYD